MFLTDFFGGPLAFRSSLTFRAILNLLDARLEIGGSFER